MMVAIFAVVIALILVIGLAGCTPAIPPPDSVMSAASPRPEIIICVDDDFNSKESSQADAAVDAWNAALRGVVTLSTRGIDLMLPATGCNITIVKLESSSPYVALQPSWELAYTSKDKRMIQVVADRRPDLRRLVLEHELGHALGLDHSITGLMRPAHATGAAQISATDAVWAAYSLGESVKRTE